MENRSCPSVDGTYCTSLVGFSHCCKCAKENNLKERSWNQNLVVDELPRPCKLKAVQIDMSVVKSNILSIEWRWPTGDLKMSVDAARK